MIEFALKSDLVSWKSIPALLIFLSTCRIINPILRYIFNRGDIIFSIAVNTLIAVIVSGFIHLSLETLIFIFGAIFITGFICRKLILKPTSKKYNQYNEWTRRQLLFVGLLIFLVIFLAFTNQNFAVHYDYFHGLSRSIDLALNSRSPSAWLSNFDPTFWFVKEQGILPVLDAIEITIFGSVSTGLAQLFLLLACVFIIRHSDEHFSILIPVFIVLALLIIDFNFAPRPHVFVGLWVAVFVLRMSQQASFAELAIYLIIMFFAKRDGAIIALGIMAIGSMHWASKRLSWGLQAAITLTLFSVVALILNSWVAIGTLTPLQALISALLDIRWKDLFLLDQIPLMIIPTIITVAIMINSKQSPRAFIGLGLVFAFIFMSAVSLEGLQRYNFGTIERKIYYILWPTLIASIAAIHKPVLFRSLSISALSAFFVFYLTPRVGTIKAHNSYQSILDDVKFISAAANKFGPKVSLVLSEPTNPMNLNRYPEIAQAPFSQLSAYIFPYLASLNNYPFSVVERSNFCRDFKPGIAFFSPKLTEGINAIERNDSQVALPLKSKYVIVVPSNQIEEAIKFFNPSSWKSIPVNASSLETLAPSAKIITVPWGNNTQYLLISKSTELVLEPKNNNFELATLRFEPHPKHPWPFESLILEGKDGKKVNKKYEESNVSINFNNVSRVLVRFGNAAYSTHFGGYVLVMHAPEISELKINNVEKLSVCNQ